MNQNLFAVLGVVAGVLVLVWAIWMIYVGVKYKANQNEEIKALISRAKATSSYVLWYMVIMWIGFASFLGKDNTFSITKVGIIMMFTLGIQSFVEVVAFFYYKDELKKKSETVVE